MIVRLLVLACVLSLSLPAQGIRRHLLGSNPGTPAFWHTLNNDAGTGTTATADVGANCDLTNESWAEDPTSSGNFYLDFNGTTSTAKCGDALDGLNDLSLSVWIKADSYGEGGAGRITGKGLSVPSSYDVQFTEASTRISLNIRNTLNSADRFDNDTAMAACVGTGRWCHIMVTVSGCASMACANAQIWVNGIPVTTTQGNDATGTRASDATFVIVIGSREDGANTFDGGLDDIRHFTAASTFAQMLYVWREGRR